MTTIVSRRHPFKFYLSIILGVLFFAGLATLLLFTYNKPIGKANKPSKEKLLLIGSIGCYTIAAYTIYRYFKNVPTITLNQDAITFNNQAYSVADIKSITLTGKQPFRYVINFPMEAAAILFTNDETKYIFDDMYSNSWQIKSFLQQVVINKQNYVEDSRSAIDNQLIANDVYTTFKGNPVASLRGISLWSIIVIFAYGMLNNKKPNTAGLIFFFFGFSTLWFIAHAYLMHYFQVSGSFFVARNHYFFWMKKAVNISDIKEIVFETQGKMPYCLRVITKDFKNKLYPAGTLTDKTWLALKTRLESCNVIVRNECIYE